MPRGLLLGCALALLAVLGLGLPAFHSRGAGPPALDGPGNQLLGRQPEADAGPIPPGTPLQPPPVVYRGSEPPLADPISELRRLKRGAERAPGPRLGALPVDAARYRQL